MGIGTYTHGRWSIAGPFLGGLVIGLLGGPLLTFWAGWAATTGTVEAKVEDALVGMQATICALRAKADVGDPSGLDYDARFKLAEKWSAMPGQKPESVDPDVKVACANKLAQAPEKSSTQGGAS